MTDLHEKSIPQKRGHMGDMELLGESPLFKRLVTYLKKTHPYIRHTLLQTLDDRESIQ